jgi:amino acid transporter
MALVGISTALLVNMLGQARIWTMAAREHLIPLFWARVSPRFGTPIAAQVTMGAASGEWRLIALLMACSRLGSSSFHFACC